MENFTVLNYQGSKNNLSSFIQKPVFSSTLICHSEQSEESCKFGLKRSLSIIQDDRYADL